MNPFTLMAVATSLALLTPTPSSAPPDDVSDEDADAAALRGELDGMRWLIFGEDEVGGDTDRPFEQIVPHRRAAKGSSLLEIRTHFMPELIRHAQDL